jgi:hypothetical protein
MIDFSTSLIKEVFGSLCQTYGLRIVPVDRNEVLFVSPKYAMYLYTDPRENAISLLYLDIVEQTGGIREVYNLDLFLVAKRSIPSPPKLTFALPELRVRAALRRIEEHLLEKGEDILKGEKEWLKDYHWNGQMAVSAEVKHAIQKVVRE